MFSQSPGSEKQDLGVKLPFKIYRSFIMSIKKQYLKKKPVCKVTFRLPQKKTDAAESIHVVGDFNNWDTKATPMKKLKNGYFTATVDLDLYKEYQFRYLKDTSQWGNDTEADKHVPTPFGDSENSVIII